MKNISNDYLLEDMFHFRVNELSENRDWMAAHLVETNI